MTRRLPSAKHISRRLAGTIEDSVNDIRRHDVSWLGHWDQRKRRWETCAQSFLLSREERVLHPNLRNGSGEQKQSHAEQPTPREPHLFFEVESSATPKGIVKLCCCESQYGLDRECSLAFESFDLKHDGRYLCGATLRSTEPQDTATMFNRLFNTNRTFSPEKPLAFTTTVMLEGCEPSPALEVLVYNGDAGTQVREELLEYFQSTPHNPNIEQRIKPRKYVFSRAADLQTTSGSVQFSSFSSSHSCGSPSFSISSSSSSSSPISPLSCPSSPLSPLYSLPQPSSSFPVPSPISSSSSSSSSGSVGYGEKGEVEEETKKDVPPEEQEHHGGEGCPLRSALS